MPVSIEVQGTFCTRRISPSSYAPFNSREARSAGDSAITATSQSITRATIRGKESAENGAFSRAGRYMSTSARVLELDPGKRCCGGGQARLATVTGRLGEILNLRADHTTRETCTYHGTSHIWSWSWVLVLGPGTVRCEYKMDMDP